MASKSFNLIRNQSSVITFTNNSYFPAGNRDKVMCIYILLQDWEKRIIIVYLINWTKKEMTTFKEFESRSDSGNNPYIKALITLTKNNVLRLKWVKLYICISG